jgi:glutaredoxin 2
MSNHYPTEINRKEVEQYFTQKKNYTIIDITSLKVEDKEFLEKVGLSLTSLELNKVKGLTAENTVLTVELL